MTDFGGHLRVAREQRGLSLNELAVRTKIPLAALEALERNDVSRLPGGIFSRAFVRAYAHEVGLDADAAVKEFLAHFGLSPTPATPTPAADRDRSFDMPQRMSVAVTLALVSLPIIGFILYGSLRTSPPQSAGARPAVRESAPATSESPAVHAVATSAASTALPAASAPGTLTLDVHPTGLCWVKVTADGRPVLARLMKAGEKQSLPFRDHALLQIGDAGAFAFSIDGQPGRSLGQPGEVRLVRISRETLSRYVQEP